MNISKAHHHQPPCSQNKLLHGQQGFSLIELLVSMALLSIMAGIGLSVFAIINTSYNQSQALSKMQTQGSQVLEVIERSIRGGSNVEVVDSSADGCDRAACLKIEIPSSSLEYQINGGCKQTVYAWKEEDASTGKNGSLVRYYLDENNNYCSGSAGIELFDENNRHGISVQQIDSEPVFQVTTGSNGIDSVKIAFNLSTGVAVTSAHANLPLRTTVGLRDY